MIGKSGKSGSLYLSGHWKPDDPTTTSAPNFRKAVRRSRPQGSQITSLESDKMTICSGGRSLPRMQHPLSNSAGKDNLYRYSACNITLDGLANAQPKRHLVELSHAKMQHDIHQHMLVEAHMVKEPLFVGQACVLQHLRAGSMLRTFDLQPNSQNSSCPTSAITSSSGVFSPLAFSKLSMKYLKPVETKDAFVVTVRTFTGRCSPHSASITRSADSSKQVWICLCAGTRSFRARYIRKVEDGHTDVPGLPAEPVAVCVLPQQQERQETYINASRISYDGVRPEPGRPRHQFGLVRTSRAERNPSLTRQTLSHNLHDRRGVAHPVRQSRHGKDSGRPGSSPDQLIEDDRLSRAITHHRQG